MARSAASASVPVHDLQKLLVKYGWLVADQIEHPVEYQQIVLVDEFLEGRNAGVFRDAHV
jgi:hypothetical protein